MNYTPVVLSKFGLTNKFSNYSKKILILVDDIYKNYYNKQDFDKIVMIQGCEPLDHSGIDLPNKIINNQNEYDLILTTDDNILNKCKNSKLCIFGSTWIEKENRITTPKIFQLSFICGEKNYDVGHKIRQQIWNNIGKVKTNIQLKLLFKGDKQHIFDNSQFALIIENSQHKNYFTEKIIDSFITKTIPIYWGCSNIRDYFNGKGFICFNTESDFFNIINNLNSIMYKEKIDIVEENYQKSLYYGDFYGRVDEEIKKIIEELNVKIL